MSLSPPWPPNERRPTTSQLLERARRRESGPQSRRRLRPRLGRRRRRSLRRLRDERRVRTPMSSLARSSWSRPRENDVGRSPISGGRAPSLREAPPSRPLRSLLPLQRCQLRSRRQSQLGKAIGEPRVRRRSRRPRVSLHDWPRRLQSPRRHPTFLRFTGRQCPCQRYRRWHYDNRQPTSRRQRPSQSRDPAAMWRHLRRVEHPMQSKHPSRPPSTSPRCAVLPYRRQATPSSSLSLPHDPYHSRSKPLLRPKSLPRSLRSRRQRTDRLSFSCRSLSRLPLGQRPVRGTVLCRCRSRGRRPARRLRPRANSALSNRPYP